MYHNITIYITISFSKILNAGRKVLHATYISNIHIFYVKLLHHTL